MDRWQYAAALAACVVITLPLEVVLGARVTGGRSGWRSPLAPVVGVFVAWDLLAARRGHWWWTRAGSGFWVESWPVIRPRTLIRWGN